MMYTGADIFKARYKLLWEVKVRTSLWPGQSDNMVSSFSCLLSFWILGDFPGFRQLCTDLEIKLLVTNKGNFGAVL